ncbi:MAG: haloacid dehalogenase type II [Ectothiorhodospiraceae bacterium]|nr:haloacid dehalogenase type II [Ectothiorhodospiraceae bacterium]
MRDTVHVLAFDVFGTVVDWYSSVEREVRRVLPEVDANAFALAWRAGYQPAMERVRSGKTGWVPLDLLHRQILEDLLARFEVRSLPEPEITSLNRIWHRLDPWPDAVEGITRLKRRYTVCTLSNGNLGLLTAMAKHAQLPWDCILSAEVFGKYKPDPDTYLGVARVFDVRPEQVMLVAAHQDDLAAARSCGLRTAYIERPQEFGPMHSKDVSPDSANTLHAENLRVLADMLE